MQSSSEQPLVGEERYVTTRITAAKETNKVQAPSFLNFEPYTELHPVCPTFSSLSARYRYLLGLLTDSPHFFLLLLLVGVITLVLVSHLKTAE